MKTDGSNYKTSVLTETEQKVETMKLCDSAFEKPVFSRHNYEELINKIDKYAEFIVAYEREIAGYCAIYANDTTNQTAYITLLVVRTQFQNKHIGKKLLQAAQELALNKGMKHIKLEVKANNINAITFYHKNGFTKLCATAKDSIYMIKTIVDYEEKRNE